MKFKVKYQTKVIFEGTIEAATEDEARHMWDEGFTPFDEYEVDRDCDNFIELKPA